ncbi:MAG: ribonuclease Z [Lacibacter sp.]
MLAVTILGNNSAIPAHGRHPTAQIITTADDLLLFDCGEGTQIQILNYRIKRSRINHIFISHLHGDHYFGLVGLLNSFALLSRVQPLHVYGPPELQQVLELQFRLGDTHLPYPFTFHAIEKDGLLLDAPHYTVECFSTKHRIACRGFLVREKRHLRKVLPEAAARYGLTTAHYKQLQRGEDVTAPDGRLVANDAVTMPNVRPKSYAFTADTIYDPELVPIVRGVDLLYHEATYLHALADKASSRFHSTTQQAASIAAQAGVKRLLIGHFSAKFEDLAPFEEEAKAVFPNSEVAVEGTTYLV